MLMPRPERCAGVRLLCVCLLCLGAARPSAPAPPDSLSAALGGGARVRRSGGYPKFPPTPPPLVSWPRPVADAPSLAPAASGPVPGLLGGADCGTRAVAHQPRRAGLPYPKIVGGTPVPYGAYPWQVEIQLRDDDEGRAEGVEGEDEGEDASDEGGGGGGGGGSSGGEEQRRRGPQRQSVVLGAGPPASGALSDGYRHHCGGAVVGARLVVSAAHCLQGAEAERLRVVLGEHRLRTRDAHERAFAVERILTHPQFRRAGPYSNDIGLLKVGGPLVAGAGVVGPGPGAPGGLGALPPGLGLGLGLFPVPAAAAALPAPSQPFAFSSHVRSICLPEDAALAAKSGRAPAPAPGAWCTVTGWGAQRADDPDSLSEVLQAAAVPLLDAETCRNDSVYGGRSQSILDSMLCAGLMDGGVDACGGDSGGPLACEVNGRFVLAGVVSWGDGCAKKNRPGVYTRISHYTSWIQASMKKLGLS